MSPKPILYKLDVSPGVRAVKMLAHVLDLELELRNVDLFNKKQFNPEYLKMNPCHTVPVLDDDGVVIWDSHAILIYLMDKYAKNDSMYPRDSVKRANINQLLFCDAAIFAKVIAIMKPIYFEGVKEVTDKQKANLEDSYESIERILDGKKFIAGNDMSIADFSLVATLTSANIAVPIDLKKYTNIAAWLKTMESLPYYELNAEGMRIHEEILKKCMSQ
ncbi:hypothetical protein HHI36_020496 [Cryptolaemus montrouzieri]|uniref:Glutathione S-transferase 1-like n=1 Tax=Cryptolaemus montrouzieri TaxID=559131 RepID=A0ABD2NBG6_9CUCU